MNYTTLRNIREYTEQKKLQPPIKEIAASQPVLSPIDGVQQDSFGLQTTVIRDKFGRYLRV